MIEIPWFKIDDNLHAHPKARRAGLEAIGLWALAGSHGMDYWNEGFVPEWFVTSWPNGKKLAARLVSASLWEVGEKNGEQGWYFHEWHERQPSKQQYETKKEATKERVANWRASRNAKSDILGNAPGNAVTPDVTEDVTNIVRTGSGTGSTSSLVSAPQVKKKTSSSSARKRAATDMPDGWKPNAKHLALAQELGVPTAGLVDNFTDHHAAKGNRFVDWDRAFFTWIRNAPNFAGAATVRHLQSVTPSRESQIAYEEAQAVAPPAESLPW